MTKKLIPLKWGTSQRKVDDLIPYEFNPRILTQDEAARLAESLNKFNLVEIPAINLDNIVIAGHMRLAIMKQLGRGEETIDVRVPNRLLTPEELKEYNIRSNKNTGQWDFDMLLNNNDKEILLEMGFKPFEFGIVEDQGDSALTTEKRYSLSYEIIFETKDDLTTFKEQVKKIRSSEPEGTTDAAALLKYLTKNLS